MLLRHDTQGETQSCAQLPPSKKNLPEEKLREFAQFVADDFRKNVGKPPLPRKHSLEVELPREMG